MAALALGLLAHKAAAQCYNFPNAPRACAAEPAPSAGPPAQGNAALNAAAAAAGVRTGTAIRNLFVGDPNAAANRANAVRQQGVTLNNQAMELERKGDWDGAVAALRRAHDLNSDPIITDNLARALYKRAGEHEGVLGTPEGDKTLKAYQEALQLSRPGSAVRSEISFGIDWYRGQQQRKREQADKDRLDKERRTEAAAAVNRSVTDNLQLASAQMTAPAVGASPGLSFSGGSATPSGNSGGLGMRATGPVDVGPARASGTTKVPDTLSALKAAAAGGEAAASSPDSDAARHLAACALDAAGSDCPKPSAAFVPAVATPPATPVTRADVLAGRLGDLARKPDVKAALDMYRNMEGATTVARADVERYASLVKAGGPDVQKYSTFLDSAKSQLAVAQHDEANAKVQVDGAVGHYGVKLPEEAP